MPGTPSFDSATHRTQTLTAGRSCRELKVKEAETALIGTLRWRDEMKIDEIMSETFPEDVFGGAGRDFGHDKEGRPVS